MELIVTQTGEPSESRNAGEKRERSKLGKKKDGEGGDRGVGVEDKFSGQNGEIVAEKDLKRARKEAKRQEKAERAKAKGAVLEGSGSQTVAECGKTKKSKDKNKRKALPEDIDKKSKKRRIGVTQDPPKPEQDEELSDQARKALSYAYAQFTDEANWKFNKARQNWLIRNLWSESNVPEKYMPLLSKYLSKVQGGVRENLVKACQAHLVPQTTPSVPEVPTTEGSQNAAVSAPEAASTTSDAIRERAKTILDALGVN